MPTEHQKVMKYSLTAAEGKVYSTTDSEVFQAVTDYLEHETVTDRYIEEIAEAVLQVGTVMQRQKFKKVLREYCPTPALLRARLSLKMTDPIALADLNFSYFKRQMNPAPTFHPLLQEILTIFPVVVAGGTPTSQVLCLPKVGVADDDIWVYGRSAAVRKELYQRVSRYLFKQPGVVAGSKGGSVLIFAIPGYPRNVQLILTSARTPEEVVSVFDMDACRSYALGVPAVKVFGFEWSPATIETYALPEALQAWETNRITIVPVVDALRLEKMKLRGFEIEVPYTPPSEEEMTKYLSRSYIHRRSDDQEIVENNFKSVLGVEAVFHSSEEVRDGFAYREIYDLNLDYELLGLKVLSDCRVFGFMAKVQKLFVRNDDHQTHRFALLPQDFPGSLQELDNELYARYQRGIVYKDGLTIYADGIPELTKEVEDGLYQVQLQYGGVAAMPGRPIYYPILRVTSLTPV